MVFEYISRGRLCLSLQSDPHACWKAVFFAGLEKVKRNLRTGLEPSLTATVWQVARKGAELPPAPLVLGAPAHPTLHKQLLCQWADVMPIPGGSPERSSPLHRLMTPALGGRAGLVDCCGLLRPTGAAGQATAGDRILQQEMLERVHQPVPVLWGCVMHTSMVYAVDAVFI